MKIVFVITGLGLGGAEKQICLLADQLADAGNEIKIISLTGETVVKPENSHIEIYPLDMKKSPFGFLSGLLNLRKTIKNFKPDVVHSHMFHANIMMRLAGILTHRHYRLICTAHSKNEGGKLRMFLYRFTDSLCDFNTNVSKEALDEYINKKAFSPSKSLVIYNGIDTEKFKFSNNARISLRKELAINESEQLILTVGRLTPAKDYPNLLSAFSQLPECFKLVIIGEGEVRQELENIIRINELGDRVKMLGGISSVSDYYSACDLFVLPSAWEGFGLVVAEAMACERITVCTDAGGVKEVVGNTDFIVPVSDSKALANKIVRVSELSEERKAIIEKENRKYIINNFSIASVIDRWLSVYKTMQVNK